MVSRFTSLVKQPNPLSWPKPALAWYNNSKGDFRLKRRFRDSGSSILLLSNMAAHNILTIQYDLIG